MPTPQQIAEETYAAICEQIPEFAALPDAAKKRAHHLIQFGIQREVQRSLHEIWNTTGDATLRAVLLKRIDGKILSSDFEGNRLESNTRTPHWTEWYPGLDNDDTTLGAVLDELPGLEAKHVPSLVRLFENPDSPVALPGAVSLELHDIVHVLLGRGLVDQDEAFVIGFTAAADKPDISDEEVEAYKVGFESYQEPYRITGQDLLAFDFGIQAGRLCAQKNPALRNLLQLDVEAARGRKIGELRSEYGIDHPTLQSFYALEQQVIPGTPASLRLPVGKK